MMARESTAVLCTCNHGGEGPRVLLEAMNHVHSENASGQGARCQGNGDARQLHAELQNPVSTGMVLVTLRSTAKCTRHTMLTLGPVQTYFAIGRVLHVT